MMRRAALLGGNWNDGDWSGSRNARVTNWPDNSNEWIGARGRSDDRVLCFSSRGSVGHLRLRLRPCRLHTSGPYGPRWSARSSCFGEHRTSSGRTGRSDGAARRLVVETRGRVFSTPDVFMARHYRNLIAEITSDQTLREAVRLTARGKRLTPGYLEFKQFDALNLVQLGAAMRDGSYRPGEPHEFQIFDPKLRTISALPFRDRVAQQALCLVIGPIFDRALLPHCYASRPGKGTHAGVRAVQADLRRLAGRGVAPWFLKTDFSRYFASIDHAVLWRLITRKISCAATLRLIETMVSREGIGLPIGSLTSQIFANVYCGLTLDRYLQQELREPSWFRYMDDLVVLGDSPAHLRAVRDAIERYSADTLGLRFSKWHVSPAQRGINFLGYRIWASHKLLRPDSVKRARRKIAAYRAAGDHDRLQRFLGAWLGHASHADSGNLLRALGVDGGPP